MKKIYIYLLLSLCLFTLSCEEPKIEPENSLNHFIYDYMKKMYLWNEQLPAKENVDFSLSDPNEFVKSIRYNTLDKFSVVSRNAQQILNSSTNSIIMDIGLKIVGVVDASKEMKVFFALVFPNSPADELGLKRGMKILKIDGVLAKDIKEFYSYLPHTIVYVDESNKEKEVTLQPKVFTRNNVLSSKVLEINNKKIGYFSYYSFTGISTGKQEIIDALKPLADANVEEMIVDLRYNGGGISTLSQTLSSILMPAESHKEKIFTVIMNNTNIYSIKFIQVPFNFSLKRIFFITSKNTGSASEQTIISLQPYMDVYLVGENTYGKFCGGVYITQNDKNDTLRFLKDYPEDILSKNDLLFYPMESKYANALLFTDFVAGLQVNKEVFDDASEDFGNPKEVCLSQCLYFIENGAFEYAPAARTASLENVIIKGTEIPIRPLLFNK